MGRGDGEMPVSSDCRKPHKIEFLTDSGCWTFLRGIFLFFSLTFLPTHVILCNFSALLGVMGREGTGERQVAARDPTVWQPVWLLRSRGKVFNGATADTGFNQLNC